MLHNIERLFSVQAQQMSSQKTMEVNPRHPIIAELNRQVKANPDSQEVADAAWLLYDTALLQSGFAQDDVDAFAGRMYRTMKGALKLDSLELEAEVDVPEEADADEESEEDGEGSPGDEL
jgi:HSP90 family molecular chaperone